MRPSATGYIPLTWALLGLLAGLRAFAAAAATSVTSSDSLTADKFDAKLSISSNIRIVFGVMSLFLCLSFASYQIAIMPDAPAQQWRLPVRVLTLFIAGLASLYQTLVVNKFVKSRGLAAVLTSSTDTAVEVILGYLISATLFVLAPLLVVVFIASLITKAVEEKVDSSSSALAEDEVQSQVVSSAW